MPAPSTVSGQYVPGPGVHGGAGGAGGGIHVGSQFLRIFSRNPPAPEHASLQAVPGLLVGQWYRRASSGLCGARLSGL